MNTGYEVKRNSRFLVKFTEELNIEPWKVQRITLPKYTDFKWQDIKIDFIDPVASSTSQDLYNFIKKNEKETKSPIFTFKIKFIDSTGQEISEWTILVKNIKYDFGELDYGNDNLLMLSITIEPLDCILDY